ncbi:MAG: T9SS type A sorting domain-containing protein, partial [Mangrovimonas sp.]|nr:T9SS type A sorting domain-containing protein [Mangrovimonas sp.]
TDDVFVYPNPFSDQITIYNVSEGGVKVAAYNSLGQLVFSKTFVQHEDKLTVDTSHWSVGLYTMVLQTNNSVSTFKIVKK